MMMQCMKQSPMLRGAGSTMSVDMSLASFTFLQTSRYHLYVITCIGFYILPQPKYNLIRFLNMYQYIWVSITFWCAFIGRRFYVTDMLGTIILVIKKSSSSSVCSSSSILLKYTYRHPPIGQVFNSYNNYIYMSILKLLVFYSKVLFKLNDFHHC